jgi:hypothetical protein
VVADPRGARIRGIRSHSHRAARTRRISRTAPIGGYAIVFGVLVVIFAFKIRSFVNKVSRA